MGAPVVTRSLAAYARKATDNGRELVDFMVDVMRGHPLPVRATRAGRTRYPQIPKVEHRMGAAMWLADRGWGKAKELIELQGDTTTTPEQRLALLRRLSDEDQATLRQLLVKALASAPPAETVVSPPLEPEAAGDLEAGAPLELGRPRNVGRAVVPELAEPEPALVSPVDPPADDASSHPTTSE